MANIDGKLVVAISSRALFDLDESHHIYETEGLAAYAEHQITHEKTPLARGVAYPLVEKLCRLRHPETGDALVEVILLSRNSADTGLRIFHSIEHHDLQISRAAFTSGGSPYRYVQAFNAHLFLSAHPEDVRQALASGCAAATIYPSRKQAPGNAQLRIAFDGDAVLFSDEAERIFQEGGLDKFCEHEKAHAHNAMEGGPFKGFLHALHQIQSLFSRDECPIHTALITARSAPAHERVVRTLRDWQIRIDEALFLGGLDKGAFLGAYGADFFFDDQTGHCESTSEHVATGHVPHGVSNL